MHVQEYRIESLLLIVILWVSPSSRSCPEPVDGSSTPLWVLGEPPVGQSVELCDLSAGARTRAATLLVGGVVVVAGLNRQAWTCGGALEIATQPGHGRLSSVAVQAKDALAHGGVLPLSNG